MTVTVRNPTSDNPTQTMITTGLYPNRNVRQRRRTTPGRRGHASVASLARYTRVSPDAGQILVHGYAARFCRIPAAPLASSSGTNACRPVR
jgi:hypothetical protein